MINKMERIQLVNFLCQLNSEDETETCNQQEELFQTISQELNCTYEGIVKNFPDIFSSYFSQELPAEWKCIALSFHILSLLSTSLDESEGEILSVKQTKSLKNCIKNIVSCGICSTLLPNLPFYLKPNSPNESKDIFLNYNILKCTTLGLCQFLKSPNLRLLILSDNLKEILVAIYQISYCPLKQPSGDITQEIYQRLLEEKQIFLALLAQLNTSIHPGIYVRDTMVILQSNAPAWFKKAVSQTLTKFIRSKNGVEHICGALLGGSSNDSGQTWKTLEVISKLILRCKKFPDFRENICKQLTDLLDKVTEDTFIYERIYSHCTRSMYRVDEELTKEVFLRPLVGYLAFFTYKSHKFGDKEDLTEKMKQTARLLQGVFVDSSVELPKLPVEILTPVLMVLFRFYALTSHDSFKSTNEDLKSILLLYLETFLDNSFALFDSFLFGIGSKKILSIRNDMLFKFENDKILLNHTDHSTNYSVTENSERLLELVETKTNILVKLFCYLLNCLINKEKYFEKANEDLLSLEDEFLNEFIERNLVVYKLLSDLAEDKNIQNYLTKNPEDVIRYIETVLKKTIELSTHKSNDADSAAYQSLFTVLMILQSLVSNCAKSAFDSYNCLVNPLEEIYEGVADNETKDIVKEILDILDKRNVKGIQVDESKSELDKALEDICDPLLPTRGHGLMSLAKLVEKKDKNVMERKQYVLNIFQQNLKNEDSYIYLSAIAGLAGLADVFSDTVLNILCEEYSDSSRKNADDGHEVRIKLGETLVRVTKVLGEMAPKYKPLLLNTFLVGAKDDDDLIRASSLSNLGEICRVLGYKLGTIITEVLVCVHAVISTDKSPQARRAAVTVLRQLFLGLEKEMIAFLKDDILPIYRTLKEIYNGDKDEIMRLQAQLALEELNENVKQFVLPNPQLHTEKRVVMLD